MKYQPLKYAFTTAAILAASLTSQADTFSWNTGANDYWNVASRWTNNTGTDAAPPNNGDTAFFYGAFINGNVYFNSASVNLGTLSVDNNATPTIRTTSSSKRNLYINTGSQDLLVNSELTFGYVTALTRPFNIIVGTSNSASSRLYVGTINDGTLNVVGTQTVLSVNGTSTRFIGANGNTGRFNINNGATANVQGTLNIGTSISNSTVGFLNINFGTLNSQNITVASSSSGAIGTILLNNNAQITQSGTSTLTVGSALGGSSAVLIDNSDFFTGTGAVTLANTGYIRLTNNANLTTNGTMTVTDSSLTAFTSSDITLNQNLTLNNSLLGLNSSTALNIATDKSITANNNSNITFGTAYDIQNNNTFNLNQSTMTASSLVVGRTNHGTINSNDSNLTISGITRIGFSGGNGTVNLTNNALAQFQNSLHIANSSTNTSQGTLNITDSTVNITNDLRIATLTGSQATGNLTASGNSTITQAGGGAVFIGSNLNGSANITLNNITNFHSGTGDTNINSTGSLILNDSADYFANGNIIIDGGTLRTNTTSARLYLTGGLNITAKNNGTLIIASQQSIEDQSTLSITSNAHGAFSTLRIGSSAADTSVSHTGGNLLVTGTGSSANGTNLRIGNEGTKGTVEFADNATSTFNFIQLAYGNATSNYGRATLDINSGAIVTVRNLYASTRINNANSSRITVTGENSHLDASAGYTQLGGGHEDSETLIYINYGGTFTTGSSELEINQNVNMVIGTNVLNSNGTLNISGNVDYNGGTVNLRRGTINFTNQNTTFYIGNNQLLGNLIHLASYNTIDVQGTTHIQDTGTLNLTNTFTTNKIINNGTINLRSDATVGDATQYAAYTGNGVLNIGSRNFTINSASFAQLGNFTTTQGIFTANNGISIGNGSTILASNQINAAFSAATGSTLALSGNLTIGDNTEFDGFYSNGRTITDKFTLTINDKNQAVLGSITKIGTKFAGGVLNANNGIILAIRKKHTRQRHN